jgi:hypothetical protein
LLRRRRTEENQIAIVGNTGNTGNRKLMKETKSQNQQACQKKKYTSQKSENVSVSKKTSSDVRERERERERELQELIEVGTPQEQVLPACIILV